MADLFACKRSAQKLTNRYEHTPMPSQPQKNCKRFADDTKTSIKKPKKFKYEKKVKTKGSKRM